MKTKTFLSLSLEQSGSLPPHLPPPRLKNAKIFSSPPRLDFSKIAIGFPKIAAAFLPALRKAATPAFPKTGASLSKK